MKMWRTAVAAIVLAGALPAAAQNLLTNGSFEGGSLAGWTLVESGAFSPGNCTIESLTPPSNTAGFGAFTTQPATDGTFTLMGDANNPGTCQFFQDVVMPTGNGLLSYAAGYNYAAAVPGAPVGCDVSVAITTTGNVPIATGYTASGATNDPMAARTPITFSVAPGSTVRVMITEDSCNTGPVGIVADNFVLAAAATAPAVPALDDWAKLALALTMGAFGFAYLRRSIS